MHIAPFLQQNLRSNLISLLAGCHNPPQLNQIIAASHSLAVAYVGRRISNGHFNRILISSTPDDIAYDCIADIFERDDEGQFIQLKAYFDGIRIDLESDEALLIHLRRLTFTKVNHGIFRIYNEADPSLGKILRNIKGAVSTLNNFLEAEIFGEHHLIPCGCDPLRHLPAMDHAYFEEQFSRNALILPNIPALLGHLSLFLREQHEFRRSVSLMAAAIVFRNIFAHKEQSMLVAPQVEAAMDLEDAQKIIAEACSATRQEMSRHYVGKKKVDPVVFNRYFTVIEANLIQTIVEKDGQEFSFFDSLQALMPELTKEEYRDTHKSILEYTARCTREKTQELFKLRW